MRLPPGNVADPGAMVEREAGQLRQRERAAALVVDLDAARDVDRQQVDRHAERVVLPGIVYIANSSIGQVPGRCAVLPSMISLHVADRGAAR